MEILKQARLEAVAATMQQNVLPCQLYTAPNEHRAVSQQHGSGARKARSKDEEHTFFVAP